MTNLSDFGNPVVLPKMSHSDTASAIQRRKERTHQQVEHEQRRLSCEAAGLPALYRLVEVADRDTGQSQVCGRFLLALYNSHAFPFNLTDLRRLEQPIWADCILVLGLDHRPRKEVHLLIEGGPEIWERLKTRWAPRQHAGQ